MKRRAFLETAAIVAIGAAAGSPAAGATPGGAGLARGWLPEETAIELADRLLHAYPLKRSLAAIGGVFWRENERRENGCDTCLPAMMEDFLRHLDLAGMAFKDMPPAAIRDQVRDGNAADFSMGRIVPVRGWLLGETEARLCAIAALRAT